jgi:hypothetical protein
MDLDLSDGVGCDTDSFDMGFCVGIVVFDMFARVWLSCWRLLIRLDKAYGSGPSESFMWGDTAFLAPLLRQETVDKVSMGETVKVAEDNVGWRRNRWVFVCNDSLCDFRSP